MKIQFLGTAAAEAIPGLFCDCEVCKKSRAAGGRNIRTRSQALVDGKILIDFPAETYIHSIQNNIELSKIHTCIITHNHADHLYPADFESRRIGFAYTDEDVLTVYGTYPAYEQSVNALLHFRMDEDNRVKPKRIEAFVPFEAEGYKITPLKADHDFKCDPVFYLIEKDGKTLMYAHDTGIFPDETWEYLKNNPVHLDLVSLDCTCMGQDISRGHMGLAANIEVRKKIVDLGLADSRTKFILNHFSHNGGYTYDEFSELAAKEGFDVSYDGMTVEF